MTLDLPTVRLDSTIADLYRRASRTHGHKRIAQVVCGVSGVFPLTSSVPRNTKYLYQDGPFNTASDRKASQATVTEDKRQLAMKYLSLVPQRDAFICGNTDAVIFHISDSPNEIQHQKDQAAKTLAVLEDEQRPSLVFCPGPGSIPTEKSGIDLIAYKIVIDDLSKYELLVPLDSHWSLNTKCALSSSGLPTPKCHLIELDGIINEASECCIVCQADPSSFPVSGDCRGARNIWLQEQSLRIIDRISKHPLPFVLKNQQSFGGAGTYLIRDAQQRQTMLQELEGGVLRRQLSFVSSRNAYLSPATMLLSDLVANPIGDYGLTFFVGENDGDDIFLAASEQLVDSQGCWTGSSIQYSNQAKLEKKFEKLVERIASWLRQHGYIGPAGADILETQGSSNSAQGHQKDSHRDFPDFHIVDLNVRTTGSHCLPLLRGHFTSRGLDWAASFSISVKKSRDEFISMFSDDLLSGRICILSWYEDLKSDVSLADLAIGSESNEALEKSMNHINKITEEITF